MQESEGYYSAKVACQACGVTARQLDYWITSGVIEPTRVLECERQDATRKRRRAYHLFDFKVLLRIKLVGDLRQAGASLQRIRDALKRLSGRRVAGATWLVTDGKGVFQPTNDPACLESMANQETGQFVFAAIVVGTARDHVKRQLARCERFPHDRYHGVLKQWNERTISA